jgi:hypothetical protein
MRGQVHGAREARLERPVTVLHREANDDRIIFWYIRQMTPRMWTVYLANFNHLSHAIDWANFGKGL